MYFVMAQRRAVIELLLNWVEAAMYCVIGAARACTNLLWPTSGRAKMGVTAYYSYIHVRTKSIYMHLTVIQVCTASSYA